MNFCWHLLFFLYHAKKIDCKKKKSTLSNTPYTISEFGLSVDSHTGKENLNSDKDGILMLLASLSLQNDEHSQWESFKRRKSFLRGWNNTDIPGLPKANGAEKVWDHPLSKFKNILYEWEIAFRWIELIALTTLTPVISLQPS